MTQFSWLILSVVGLIAGFGLGFLVAMTLDYDLKDDDDEHY